MYIYRRGTTWYLYHDRKRTSLHTRDRQVALALQRKAELEVLGGGKLVPKSLEQFREDFLVAAQQSCCARTLRQYGHVLTAFVEFVHGRNITNVADVDPVAVDAYTAWARKQFHRITRVQKTDGGIKYDLRVLHRFFAYSIECEYTQRNPVLAKNRNVDPGRTIPFSRDDIDRMLAAPYLNDRAYLRAVVMVFLTTGLRLNDLIDLRKDGLSGDRHVLRTKKRKKDVTLHLHPDTRDALTAHLLTQNPAQRASLFLFPSQTGKRFNGLDKHLRRLWKRCGVTGGHAHRFRDTFAVRLLENGASLYDVAKLLGIGHGTAELHYTPYVKELQERGAQLVKSLDFSPRKNVRILDTQTRQEQPVGATKAKVSA